MKTKSITLLITGTFLLSSCAIGTNFTRPQPGALSVGHSHYSDVVNLLGNPRFPPREEIINGEKIQTTDYAFYKTAKFVGLVSPSRFMHLTFHNDMLVGEEYTSSFEEDSTKFNVDRVFSLVNRKSTKEDVISALGKPSGEIIYPLVKDKSGIGLVYWYSEFRPEYIVASGKTYRLIVFLDANNVVTDISYKEDYGKEQFRDHVTSKPTATVPIQPITY